MPASVLCIANHLVGGDPSICAAIPISARKAPKCPKTGFGGSSLGFPPIGEPWLYVALDRGLGGSLFELGITKGLYLVFKTCLDLPLRRVGSKVSVVIHKLNHFVLYDVPVYGRGVPLSSRAWRFGGKLLQSPPQAHPDRRRQRPCRNRGPRASRGLAPTGSCTNRPGRGRALSPPRVPDRLGIPPNDGPQ